MSMSCFDCHDYMDGYNNGKKEGTIEEIEKMIIKIGNIEETKTYFKKIVFKNPQEIKNEVMELLNERISELKGE